MNGPFFKILTGLLKSRKQRVILNGLHSAWTDVLAGVPQGSVIDPLLFLIYIDNLPDVVKCNPKSFFAAMYNFNEATNDLDNDLIKITK